MFTQERGFWNFLGGTVDKNLHANAGDVGSIPGLGTFHMPQGNYTHVSQLLKLALEPSSHNY